MNPGVLFLPVFRASTTAFLLGLLVLAIVDYVRLGSGINPRLSLLSMVALWFFVFSLHANRRRYVERGAELALLPLGLAVLGKGIGWFVGVMGYSIQAMIAFAADNGVDIERDATMGEAFEDPEFLEAVGDPGFMQAFSDFAENDPELNAAAAQAGAFPSFLGFWLILLAFIPWFALMKRRGGQLAPGADTPSLFNPAPLADPPAREPAEAATTETAADTVTAPDAVPAPVAEPEAAAKPEPQTKAEPEAEPEAEAVPDPQTEADPEVEPEAEAAPEPQTEAEPEAEPDAEAQAEEGNESELDAEPAQETETEAPGTEAPKKD